MDDKRQALARALLGSGMVGQTADTMRLYPQYQQYAIETQTQGQQPLPFQQWAQQFQQQQQAQPMPGAPNGS